MTHTLIFVLLLMATPAIGQPYFLSSVTSNDIDYLTREDVSAFYCLDYDGPATREMIYRGVA
ncbi:MAG: hypothetical protein AAF404_16385, partial [Pseudomonadota bacterium]